MNSLRPKAAITEYLHLIISLSLEVLSCYYYQQYINAYKNYKTLSVITATIVLTIYRIKISNKILLF